MTQARNVEGDGPPLTARSVIASTLLGTEGLALRVQALVRAGELFGIAEGTTRVALSRMVASGELVAEPGRYRLAGRLVERSQAQEAARRPVSRPWRGDWHLAIVTSERRPAPERALLRKAMARLHLAEWREGVWLRPDNLGRPERLPEAALIATEQCTWLVARLDGEIDARLATRLWALDDWAATTEGWREAMAATAPLLEAGDTGALRRCFLLAAGVVRHVSADPLLPAALLPSGWPGVALREEYDRYQAALQGLLRTWFGSR
jgi:phenylacetic acid degradation operon negative regulatory protein